MRTALLAGGLAIAGLVAAHVGQDRDLAELRHELAELRAELDHVEAGPTTTPVPYRP